MRKEITVNEKVFVLDETKHHYSHKVKKGRLLVVSCTPYKGYYLAYIILEDNWGFVDLANNTSIELSIRDALSAYDLLVNTSAVTVSGLKFKVDNCRTFEKNLTPSVRLVLTPSFNKPGVVTWQGEVALLGYRVNFGYNKDPEDLVDYMLAYLEDWSEELTGALDND